MPPNSSSAASTRLSTRSCERCFSLVWTIATVARRWFVIHEQPHISISRPHPLTKRGQYLPSAIPKGWNHSAQGCEERATLGVLVMQVSTLQGLYQLLSMNSHAPITESRNAGTSALQPFQG